MKSQVESVELMQRIRREARRNERKAFRSPTPAEPAIPAEAVALPAAPAFAAAQGLLDHVGSMLDRAREKTTVRKGVPKFLRPFYRNQGGYNDIVLEALERLRESNRLLMSENVQLRTHVQRQSEWMQAVEQRFARLEKRFAAWEGPDEQDNHSESL